MCGCQIHIWHWYCMDHQTTTTNVGSNPHVQVHWYGCTTCIYRMILSNVPHINYLCAKISPIKIHIKLISLAVPKPVMWTLECSGVYIWGQITNRLTLYNLHRCDERSNTAWYQETSYAIPSKPCHILIDSPIKVTLVPTPACAFSAKAF